MRDAWLSFSIYTACAGFSIWQGSLRPHPIAGIVNVQPAGVTMSELSTVLPPDPREQARLAVNGVIDLWKAKHYPDTDFSDQAKQISSRVQSWIAPTSVIAGVNDVMRAARISGSAVNRDSIDILANDLAHRLSESGLLAAQPRRAGLLS
jgi:hypothetical protein